MGVVYVECNNHRKKKCKCHDFSHCKKWEHRDNVSRMNMEKSRKHHCRCGNESSRHHQH